MANMFRLLRADEIDVRIGNTNKAKTKANLLLYKDARCDQNVLDETVGPYNWQRKHDRDNANCTVSIWDKEKGQWISKEDTGTESKTEAEKGLASDSFKRACFNWGIGRELYTAPQIWVPYDQNVYERYSVAEIAYDENREISKLAIANKAGSIIFRYGGASARDMTPKAEPAPDDAQNTVKQQEKPAATYIPEDAPGKIEQVQHAQFTPAFNATDTIKNYCAEMEISIDKFGEYYDALVKAKLVPRIKAAEMTKNQCMALLNAVTLNCLQGKTA